MLSNYRQEDVVYALMTHLKEREGELRRITEQRNLSLKLKLAADTSNTQLQDALSIQKNVLAEKEQTIRSLEEQPEQSRIVNGGEERIKELTEEVTALNEERIKVKDAYSKVMADKDDTISSLQATIDELTSKLTKLEKRKSSRHSTRDYESRIEQLEQQLEQSQQTSSDLELKLEESQKVVKRKDWMISSMKTENEQQRHREDNLHVHVQQMQTVISTYETQFCGRNVDVPMILAKLSDAEARSKELAEGMCQMEIQMSVMRMEFRKHGLDLEKIEMDFPVVGGTHGAEGEANAFNGMPSTPLTPRTLGTEDDTATLDSRLDPYDPFGNGKDDISLLKQDVKKGIKKFMDGGLCQIRCVQDVDIDTREDERLTLDIDAVYTDVSTTFEEETPRNW